MRAAAIAIGLTLLLAAFAPPGRSPAPLEPSRQQAIPKSWIPEQKAEQAPPITLDVPARQPSTYKHPNALTCSTPDTRLAASARNFVEAYQGAKVALEANRLEDTLNCLERATAYARSEREWMAIEMMRVVAFSKLGNDAELVATLEAMLSAKECLPADKLQEYQRMLEDARGRLGR